MTYSPWIHHILCLVILSDENPQPPEAALFHCVTAIGAQPKALALFHKNSFQAKNSPYYIYATEFFYLSLTPHCVQVV